MSNIIQSLDFIGNEEKDLLLDIVQIIKNSEKENDIFIDVKSPLNKNEAIVVGEFLHLPNSNYQKSVLGEKAYRNNEPAVLKCLDTGLSCFDLKAVSQEERLVKQSVVPIRFNAKVIGCIIEETSFVKEKSQEKNKEKLLSEDAMSILLKLVGDEENANGSVIDKACLVYDRNDSLIHYNYSAKELYANIGFTEELNSYTYKQLILTSHKDSVVNEATKNFITVGDFYFSERKISFDKGDIKTIILIEDLTTQRETDLKLYNSKQVIREIHHRIKNNLQIISSLLRIQASSSSNEETKKVLQESTQRIRAISVVHDLLSITTSEQLLFSNMVEKLVQNSQKMMTDKDILFEQDVDKIFLDANKATTLTIIISELISNSVEHAFEGIENPEIIISVKSSKNYITLKVSDNGVGTSKNVRTTSLGTRIIEGYVKENLQGTINVDTSAGRTTTIKFYN